MSLEEDPPARSRWVAYVGPFAFPAGGAAARRVLGNAQSLVAAGYRVAVACGQLSGWPQGSEYQRGISVFSLGERNAEHWPRPLRRLRYAAMGHGTCEWLDGQPSKPAAVILYSGYTPYLLRLTSWCRRNGVPLVFEAVEWYEPRSVLGGLLSPYHWNIELAMRLLIKRVHGVIAISSFLASYYTKAGKTVVTVPPTLDVASIDSTQRQDGRKPLELCYAGTPGRNKDLLDPILEALLRLDPEGEHLLMHIAGLDDRAVLALPPLARRQLRTLPGCLRVHGPVSHSTALALVQTCDFSVLLRADNRVAKAGFSTKFVESMAAGTPVIGNLTGDLLDYLKDGDTGLVCADWSATEAERALRRALSLSSGELLEMRRRCRQLAAERFDYRVHVSALSSFLDGIASSQTIESRLKAWGA